MDGFSFGLTPLDQEQNDPAVVQTIDLGGITQMSKAPDSYPRDCKDGSFCFDVKEGKEIRTYYFACSNAQEREAVLQCIIGWRKWALQLKKTDIPSLQKQLVEAHQTIEALSSELRKLREQQQQPQQQQADDSHSADMDLLAETILELRSENARLTEALEEEKVAHSDLKKQYLEQKRQMSNLQAQGEDLCFCVLFCFAQSSSCSKDDEEEDPLDFFKKK